MKETKRNYIFLLLAFLLLGACKSSPDETEIQTLFGNTISHKTVDDFIESQMESLHMPALSIAIINNGKVVYHGIKGYADKERDILADNQSIFEGASMSKSVFGFFVMTFVESGLLDLDKPLHEYLPNPDIAHDERYKKITARMVLSHRSGFPNWRGDSIDKKLFIQFEPGTDFYYSGEGYQYLAEVLKHILNTNWAGLESEFQKRVAIPFNMEHTKFIKDEYIRKHKVQPYDKAGNWVDKSKSDWWKSRDSVFVAPTTIHSEAVDFSKWMIAMMNQNGLTQAGFDELYKPHSEVSSGLIKEEYSLGFSIQSISDFLKLFAHSGNNSGFSSCFLFDEDKKWGFVFFTNSEAGDDFVVSLTYNLLLVGTQRKLVTIGLTFLLSLVLITTNLTFLIFGNRVMQKLRKEIVRIGLLVSLSTILIIFLILIGYNLAAFSWYYLVLFVGAFGVIKTLHKIDIAWRFYKDKKTECAFQAILLLSMLLSGIAISTFP